MVDHPWHLEIHPEFDYENFLRSLSPQHALTVSTFLFEVTKIAELRQAPSSWIKPLKAGLFEFRISANGALVRVFFTYKKGRIIFLLAAYDKGADSSPKRQQQEISIARKRIRSA
jgi:putative component of toxin-antitoxin plasmid stabilization module